MLFPLSLYFKLQLKFTFYIINILYDYWYLFLVKLIFFVFFLFNVA